MPVCLSYSVPSASTWFDYNSSETLGIIDHGNRAAATALLRALAPAPDRDAFAEASAAALGASDSSALVALRFPAKPKRAAGDTKRVPLRERMAAARGN